MRSVGSGLMLAACLGASLGACAPSSDSDAEQGGFGGMSGFAGIGGAAGTGGPVGACVNNDTAQCNCGGTLGSAVCVSGTWAPCVCAGAGGSGGSVSDPIANRRADLSWSWQVNPPSGGCRPGHYEGTFAGLYASSLTVVGSPIPVAPIDTPGNPGLQFDLVAMPGGGEILQVSGGKMKGNALGLFPFEFDIVGSLDCDTLKFEAELVNGFYSLGGVGRFEMEGPITADYDPVTGSMTNGHWIVCEPGSMPPWGSTMPWYGGEGNWSAMWTRP